MIIDANMYWFLEEIFKDEKEASRFLSEIPKQYGIDGYMKINEETGRKQIVIEKPAGFQGLNYVQDEYLLEKQLEDMKSAMVDKAILKIPGCHEWMSIDMCRKFNDGMAEYAKKSGGKLIPLAVLPPYGTKECFEEIERCRKELGINGVQLCAHYGNQYLDSEIFADFFKKLNEEETTVYIHHTPVPVHYEDICEYNNLRRFYGRCTDQTIAIGRELFSGFFEKYNNLKFVHSMLGGGFFAIANMLFPHKAKNKEDVSRFNTDNGDIEEIFKKHIFFEMSHAKPWGKEQLECAVSVLGADHIIFGSSYPVRKEWLTEGPEFVNNLDISDEDKEKILYKNAEIIYNIK